MSDCDHNDPARYQISARPQIRHELRIDRKHVMVANQPARAEITDFGDIKRLVSPPGWLYKDQPQQGIGARQLKMFQPPEAREVSINVFYRGMPIADEPAKLFHDLLQSKASQVPSKLTPDEIKASSAVLGLNTVGDNQYSNTAAKGTREFAVFNMKSAEVVKLNGRLALRVSGNFQDENANVTMEYQGFFIQPSSRQNDIEEIFYQAPSRIKFLKYVGAFDQCVRAVEWK